METTKVNDFMQGKTIESVSFFTGGMTIVFTDNTSVQFTGIKTNDFPGSGDKAFIQVEMLP